MDMYSNDLALFDFGYTDLNVFESYTRSSQLFSSTDSIDTRLSIDEDLVKKQQFVDGSRNPSPLRYRHDGTSPLPLGMNWSLPPGKWVRAIVKSFLFSLLI